MMSLQRPLIIASIVILTTLAYLNTLWNGLVYDDAFLILQNGWLRDLGSIGAILTSSEWSFYPDTEAVNYYRPTFHLLYLAVYQLVGESPWGYHLSGTALHIINSLLVFALAIRLIPKSGRTHQSAGGRDANRIAGAAFATSLLFALHPVHVESVAWASAVSDLLVTLFVLLSLYTYISRKDRFSILVLSPVFFFAALMSKESAVTLPVFIFLYDILLRDEEKDSKLGVLMRYPPYALAFLLYLFLRLNALGGFAPESTDYTGLSGYEGFINIFPLIPKYIYTLFVPIKLSVFHSFAPVHSALEARFILSLLFTTLLAAGAFVLWLKQRAALFVYLMTLLPLLPALYIPGLGREVFAERYLYLPSAGFTLLGGMLLLGLLKTGHRTATIALTTLIIIIFGLGTAKRSLAWKDNHSLWLDASEKAPDIGYVHLNLAIATTSTGKTEEAIESYKRAIELGLLAEDLFSAHYNLGNAYLLVGSTENALNEYKEALNLRPSSIVVNSAVGRAYLKLGQAGHAVVALRLAVGLDPKDADIHYNLGNAYAMLGLPEEAALAYRDALSLEPERVDILNNLGIVYAQSGRHALALRTFRRALEIDPENREARENMERAVGLK